MKSIVLATALFASSFSYAATADLTIEGMHCSGCKKLISSKVCDDPAIKAASASCEVKLTDEKKQMGAIHIVSKPDTTIDMARVEAQVKAAGSDYKVTKKELK